MRHNLKKYTSCDRAGSRLLSLFLLIIMVLTLLLSGCGQEKAKEADATPSASAEPVETAKPKSNIPPASTENDMMKIVAGAEGSGKKICYLTFDDGPTESVTTAVLDVLKKYDVKATFFMLGSMIEKNPDIAKRVYKEGHLLANHSYSHQYGELYANGENFMKEIRKVTELIKEVTGEEPFKLMRFPGGSFSSGQYGGKKQQYKKLLQKEGYYFADWNALNGDAEGGSRSAEQLLNRVKETAKQDHIVVLMHDAAPKKTTAESLPSIIEYLKGEGYEFRRMDEVPYQEKSGEESKAEPEEEEITDDMIL